MKYAAIFIVFGLVCVFLAATSSNVFLQFVEASSAVAFCGVGFAYAFAEPRMFLKKSDGRLGLFSYVVFWPYHLLNSFSLFVFRRLGRENAFDKIDHNVFLGCRLNRGDNDIISRLNICSVLDLTCEFSETASLRQLSYRCIPVLDTCAPKLAELQNGAAWIVQQTSEGAVYVHCALGHGRSATFVAAYLLMNGKACNAQEAVDQVAVLRSKIELSASQRALLKQMDETSSNRVLD
ncbi:MAG TPA: dual specificity protein phosphatase family protein [Abditibacteriaceae bacterium]|nr:dual specificity protein phosphatase family protein [Abditibacteriaceae bacterium]